MAKIIVTPSALRAFAQARYLQWLSKRMPKQREHVLNQRKLFIFPTQQGFIFLLVCALVLISAVNYQNNLAYVVVFCKALKGMVEFPCIVNGIHRFNKGKLIFSLVIF